MSPATYTCTIKEGFIEITGFSGAIELITLTLDGVSNPASLSTNNSNFRIEVVNSIG